MLALATARIVVANPGMRAPSVTASSESQPDRADGVGLSVDEAVEDKVTSFIAGLATGYSG